MFLQMFTSCRSFIETPPLPMPKVALMHFVGDDGDGWVAMTLANVAFFPTESTFANTFRTNGESIN